MGGTGEHPDSIVNSSPAREQGLALDWPEVTLDLAGNARVNGAVDRKTITITLLDEEEAPAGSWQVINAWPMRYTAPDFNATASEVAIESIEIAHEGMTRVS